MPNLEYANPRKFAQFDNWPYGRDKKVVCVFQVESGRKGERVTRTTESPNGRINTPKKRTYAKQVRIVDGSDGRTYIAEFSNWGHITIVESNLKYGEETIHPQDDRFQKLLKLFT